MPTILIVAASPLDQDRLRLSAEVRDIRHALQRSRHRDDWTIESNEAVTLDDFRRALLDHNPVICHFAGHGDAGGLCFEDADGGSANADAASLARLFHHFKSDLKCVLLNACYSDHQAEVIRDEIDYVIGMRRGIHDDPARRFAVAFYDAIFAGTDFRTAFDLGCTALDLNGLPDSDVPVFLSATHLTSSTLSYSAQVPAIERFLYTYYNTPFEERAELTTKGEVLQSTITKHYGEKPHRNINQVRVLSVSRIDDQHSRITVDLSDGLDRGQVTVYLRIKHLDIRVEWEATVGLWSVPPRTFLTLGSSVPVLARVQARLSDRYWGEFSDREREFQAISLQTRDGELIEAYVGRSTADYEPLMAILSDGNQHSLTLELAHVTERRDTPVVTRLLSQNWLCGND